MEQSRQDSNDLYNQDEEQKNNSNTVPPTIVPTISSTVSSATTATAPSSAATLVNPNVTIGRGNNGRDRALSLSNDEDSLVNGRMERMESEVTEMKKLIGEMVSFLSTPGNVNTTSSVPTPAVPQQTTSTTMGNTTIRLSSLFD